MASFSALRSDVIDRESRKQHYASNLMGLNAYDRHKKFMQDYALYYNKSLPASKEKRPIKTDQDTLRDTYRFIRTEEDDAENSWEQRLAKRYYDKLFKEYCIADMTLYKDGKIGFRWRVEKEVISGKGQFICGNKKCTVEEDLSSYEVNFTYKEAGESKQALVKLRVCPRCAEKLNYRREKERRRMQHSHDEDGNDMPEPEENESSKKRRILDSSEDGRKHEGNSTSSQRNQMNHRGSSDEEYDKYFEGMFL